MKKNSFWYTIVYYNILPILALGIGLIIFRDYIFELFCTLTQVTERSMFYKINGYAVDIGLAALWFMIAFVSTRDKRYKALTGRYYSGDHSSFNKSYMELVQFFTTNKHL